MILRLAKQARKMDDFSMLIKAQCEHCQSEFEDEGLEKTVWCPSCGKETHIYAKGSDYSFKPNVETADFDGIIALGYVLAIVLPAVGFFVGVYLLFKNQHGHGAAAMAMSVVFGAIWALIFLHLF
jgi:DNA-directed RNA polymerase subunit RPC12/RpoP